MPYRKKCMLLHLKLLIGFKCSQESYELVTFYDELTSELFSQMGNALLILRCVNMKINSFLCNKKQNRGSLFQERRSMVDKLANLMCSENFAHYLFVPKGKRLLGKCIPTFNSVNYLFD
jgi:hypothetical protein